jgi:hypothetical protein
VKPPAPSPKSASPAPSRAAERLSHRESVAFSGSQPAEAVRDLVLSATRSS